MANPTHGFCKTCGDSNLLTSLFEDDYKIFSELSKEDQKILNHTEDNIPFPHTIDIICDECTYNYFHHPRCPICYEHGDYCLGHSESEEMSVNNGICPICDEYIGLKADEYINAQQGEEPSGTCCYGHGLEEIREYESKVQHNRPNQASQPTA